MSKSTYEQVTNKVTGDKTWVDHYLQKYKRWDTNLLNEKLLFCMMTHPFIR